MIARIWHGYTSPENAEVYENLLKTEVFPSIEAKKVKGYRKISLLKRKLENEYEFITIMLFDDLGAVKDFAGEDYERSYVPEKAREVLARHDESSQHYEIIDELSY
jgi:heme-degrading monooxygenase HmoA